MTVANPANSISHHTCPACGLLCDDLPFDHLGRIAAGFSCAKSQRYFSQAATESDCQASVGGQACDLDTALAAAVKILQNSQQTLFAGLGTDVQGMRAILPLAEKCHATLDHMHSEASVRNTLAMQNSGWQTTTLSEVKNRADLILAIGTDIVSSHPRFFEKLVWNNDSLFNKALPNVVYLAVDEANTQAGIAPDGTAPTVLAADKEALPAILNTLNALCNPAFASSNKIGSVAGLTMEALTALLKKIQAAQYTVVVWSASNLVYPHADLTVQSITQLIAKLNEQTRVAGLSLNSGDGDTSVNQTSTWLSGYPTRNRLEHKQVRYDTQHYSTALQLKSCDALLWVSTFNPKPLPDYAGPCIAIGHPNTPFEHPPAVFIPVGVPAVNDSGTVFRMDGSIALPVRKLHASSLPRFVDVINQLSGLMP
jgi:formylmethanofuran dehydrogenase subunit B